MPCSQVFNTSPMLLSFYPGVIATVALTNSSLGQLLNILTQSSWHTDVSPSSRGRGRLAKEERKEGKQGARGLSSLRARSQPRVPGCSGTSGSISSGGSGQGSSLGSSKKTSCRPQLVSHRHFYWGQPSGSTVRQSSAHACQTGATHTADMRCCNKH